jgi:hypothetical protein
VVAIHDLVDEGVVEPVVQVDEQLPDLPSSVIASMVFRTHATARINPYGLAVRSGLLISGPAWRSRLAKL